MKKKLVFFIVFCANFSYGSDNSSLRMNSSISTSDLIKFFETSLHSRVTEFPREAQAVAILHRTESESLITAEDCCKIYEKLRIDPQADDFQARNEEAVQREVVLAFIAPFFA